MVFFNHLPLVFNDFKLWENFARKISVLNSRSLLFWLSNHSSYWIPLEVSNDGLTSLGRVNGRTQNTKIIFSANKTTELFWLHDKAKNERLTFDSYWELITESPSGKFFIETITGKLNWYEDHTPSRVTPGFSIIFFIVFVLFLTLFWGNFLGLG